MTYSKYNNICKIILGYLDKHPEVHLKNLSIHHIDGNLNNNTLENLLIVNAPDNIKETK